MRFHGVCDLFPEMSDEEFKELVADIKVRGVQVPVATYQGAIIDGKHRWKACQELGIECPTVEWDGAGSLTEHVVSLNLRRRHLTQSQKACVAVAMLPLLETEAALREKAGKAIDPSAEMRYGSPGKSTEHAAAAVGVSPRYVEQAKAILRDNPRGFVAAKMGEKTLTQVQQDIRREVVTRRVDEVAARNETATDKQYHVLVIDPPWPMRKMELDARPNQVAFDYPVMDEGELTALELPLAEDAHVFLWTTHHFLPMAFRLLEAWDLKYVCAFVWHKPNSYQPLGLPKFNCEFALYARRGTPHFEDLKDFWACFDAPQGAHSEKPEAFYEMLRRVTRGPRIDMFNRRKIDGFDGWGKEAAR